MINTLFALGYILGLSLGAVYGIRLFYRKYIKEQVDN